MVLCEEAGIEAFCGGVVLCVAALAFIAGSAGSDRSAH